MSDQVTTKRGLWGEFKDFLTTGDLVSIAVAFVMGLAVKALIDSFVHDIFMGAVGLAVKCKDVLDASGKPTGTKDCSGLVGKAYKTLAYGSFVNAVVNFIVIAFVVFVMVKVYKSVTKRQLASDGPSSTDVLLTEIRDELRRRDDEN